MPRTLSSARWPGVEFQVKDQDISNLTTWSIASNRHAVVVHLNGPIHRLETELEGAGALLHPPMAGEVWVVPAHARYASLAQGKVVRYAELFIDADALVAVTGERMELPPIRPRAGYYDEFLYRGVERLAYLTRQPDDIARMAAHGLSQALCLHFFREYTQRPPATDTGRGRLRLSSGDKEALRDYIEQHIGSPISLDALAALVRMSKHGLLTAFRGAFGTTPAQYIIEQRVRRARHLLLTTAADITTIAFETGFSSHAHLTNIFRSHVGMPPKDFRRSHRR
jgi:AraC family transcriptional regulator